MCHDKSRAKNDLPTFDGPNIALIVFSVSQPLTKYVFAICATAWSGNITSSSTFLGSSAFLVYSAPLAIQTSFQSRPSPCGMMLSTPCSENAFSHAFMPASSLSPAMTSFAFGLTAFSSSTTFVILLAFSAKTHGFPVASVTLQAVAQPSLM